MNTKCCTTNTSFHMKKGRASLMAVRSFWVFDHLYSKSDAILEQSASLVRYNTTKTDTKVLFSFLTELLINPIPPFLLPTKPFD